MRVISKNPQFPEFWEKHPDAETPLMAWYREAKKADWRNFADVRESSVAASYVKPFVVFNIGGGKYRLVTRINFRLGKVFIYGIYTHPEYDKGSWKNE
jgi:mRNA interferase HigB